MSNLIYKSETGLEMRLGIDERITILGDVSAGSMKLIIGGIKNAIKNYPYGMYCNVETSRFIIVDDELNVSNVQNVNDMSIIFIDRYDSFSKDSKKIIWSKMKKTKAIWIVMTRNPDFPAGLCCSLKSFKELKSERTKNRIRFNLIDAT